MNIIVLDNVIADSIIVQSFDFDRLRIFYPFKINVNLLDASLWRYLLLKPKIDKLDAVILACTSV